MLSGDWQMFGQSLLQSMIDVFSNKNSILANPLIVSKPTQADNSSIQIEKKGKMGTKMTL